MHQDGHTDTHSASLSILQHHTLYFLSSHTESHTAFVPLLVVLFNYGFCLAGCFADSLQLDVMASIEAGFRVCRLFFRVSLYWESLHKTPTHLSHTPRRDFTLHKGNFPVKWSHLLNASYSGLTIVAFFFCVCEEYEIRNDIIFQ